MPASKRKVATFARWADGTPRTDYIWHHPNSRRFTCRCGQYHEWPRPAGYEHKSRVRCHCGVLHVRHKEFVTAREAPAGATWADVGRAVGELGQVVEGGEG